jgi:hypothetical protein
LQLVRNGDVHRLDDFPGNGPRPGLIIGVDG